MCGSHTTHPAWELIQLQIMGFRLQNKWKLRENGQRWFHTCNVMTHASKQTVRTKIRCSAVILSFYCTGSDTLVSPGPESSVPLTPGSICTCEKHACEGWTCIEVTRWDPRAFVTYRLAPVSQEHHPQRYTHENVQTWSHKGQKANHWLSNKTMYMTPVHWHSIDLFLFGFRDGDLTMKT